MSAFSERIRSAKTGFFRVADLEGGERTLTIERLDEQLEVFGEPKDILNFAETGQQLQLNQTTAEWLIQNLGDDPETYPGKKVVLYLAPYEYKGETKQGIRLKLPDSKERPVGKPTATASAHGDGATAAPARSASRKADMDDEIPF